MKRRKEAAAYRLGNGGNKNYRSLVKNNLISVLNRTFYRYPDHFASYFIFTEKLCLFSFSFLYDRMKNGTPGEVIHSHFCQFVPYRYFSGSGLHSNISGTVAMVLVMEVATAL